MEKNLMLKRIITISRNALNFYEKIHENDFRKTCSCIEKLSTFWFVFQYGCDEVAYKFTIRARSHRPKVTVKYKKIKQHMAKIKLIHDKYQRHSSAFSFSFVWCEGGLSVDWPRSGHMIRTQWTSNTNHRKYQ